MHGTVGPSGRLSLELRTPGDPALAGLELLVQAAVAAPRGQAYLSRAASLMIR
ncbi:MAG: hypothetical protein ACE5F1_13315 [Planctomycetota bacterium]